MLSHQEFLQLVIILDIDECKTGSSMCTGEHMLCVNKPGTFECQCKKNYVLEDNICVGKSALT